MSNVLFQNALARKVQKVPPIWFMRQAGRYHKHYQGLRKDHSFDDLCKVPDLAAQVALGPVEDFDFDVAILFSDILYPLQAVGMGLEYTDHGPRLGFQLTPENIQNLKQGEDVVSFMSFQKEAMQKTRSVLPKDKSLIGFIGGPWTLFVYAVEGSHAGSLTQSKRLISMFPQFLKKMLPLLKENIRLQFEGGAEVVMIFDTAGGELSPLDFRKWVQPVLKELSAVAPGKIGYYSKNTQTTYFDQEFVSLPWAGMGFDHHWNLPNCFNVSKKGFVQGNFDQSMLFLEKSQFQESLGIYIENMKTLTPEQRAGWVSGLGHGVLPKTPEDNVRLFVETIRKAFA
ncbi:uroporphyrinogen decarboxylase family protein [Bdellovibrio sp. HCB337]|uniref:uroporphyrinogen decarboxylase family protein n=1 Tax=Bdellovibrio sp. HCB337 TaxID=3394358 RepID=UPI0039A70980